MIFSKTQRVFSLFILLSLIFILLSQFSLAQNFVEYKIEDKTTLVHHQFVLEDLENQLFIPLDATNILVKADGVEKNHFVESLSRYKSLWLVDMDFNSTIDVYYEADLVDSGKDSYFLTMFYSEGSVNVSTVLVILPEKAIISKDESISEAIIPKPSKLGTNGQNILILWNDVEINEDDVPFLVHYELPQTYFWPLVVVILLFIVLGTYFSINGSKKMKKLSKSLKHNPEPVKKVKKVKRAIMFIDLVKYTEMTSKLSEIELNELHNILDKIIHDPVEKHGGHIVKNIGDAFLITFKKPSQAVKCGMLLHDAFSSQNELGEFKHKLEIRVAIHYGDVVLRKNDVFGDVVNTASRIEGVAKKGEVLVSRSVIKNLEDKRLKYEYTHTKKLKGLKRPLNLYLVSKNK